MAVVLEKIEQELNKVKQEFYIKNSVLGFLLPLPKPQTQFSPNKLPIFVTLTSHLTDICIKGSYI